MKEGWWKYAVLALSAIAWYFVQADLSDKKSQDKALWQQSAQTKEKLTQELSEVKQRLARIEGFHEAEQFYKCKTK